MCIHTVCELHGKSEHFLFLGWKRKVRVNGSYLVSMETLLKVSGVGREKKL